MLTNVRCIAFTRRGVGTALRVRTLLGEAGYAVEVFAPKHLADEADVQPYDSLDSWTRTSFAQGAALLFVSACGIAVRDIAPYVHDKFEDPAVVCLDEAASFAVPLLSGHVGGANGLARVLEQHLGCRAVVTTATDVNAVFAVDEWASRNGCIILDRAEAKRVSVLLLDGGKVGFASDFPVEGKLPSGLTAVDEGDDDALITGISISLDSDRQPFGHTLRLVPKIVTVGVGCKRGTSAQDIQQLVDACLAEAHVAPQAVRALATIDVKAQEDGLLALAAQRGWDLLFYSAQELQDVKGDFSSSEFVRRTVGVSNVCERAACAAGARLLLGKRSASGVTCALAVQPPSLSFDQASGEDASLDQKILVCVGLGPGGADDMTLRAHKALAGAQVIVGYTTYVELVRGLYPGAEFVETPMRGEVQRCRMALAMAAEGKRVAVVCSGDPGIYGMAGLLLELADEYGVEIEVIPGVSAANGGAALLGAPLMHDWCSISLSDLLTPWSLIEERLRAAAQADFCISLYNPGSKKRRNHLARACNVLLEYKDPNTVCGLAQNVGRVGERCELLTLGELRERQVDMFTCVFVGNSQTFVKGGRMVTPRGYLQREA
ncbi:MAG: precorrin-3B C(17)-methyltransferase [Atopobiaceae bacterium]|nr:precorrin-3B C(17)-methyltransferase [Atopobiaceae bacterium]